MNTKQKSELNILLADDDKDDRFFFERALKTLSQSTQLITVSDGAQLIDYLIKNEPHRTDVIFMDLNMPRKNGLECLQEIKEHKNLKHIPVIIYTTSLTDENIDLFYKMGAHYYMHKCDFNSLPAHIARALALVLKNPKQPSKEKFLIDLQEEHNIKLY